MSTPKKMSNAQARLLKLDNSWLEVISAFNDKQKALDFFKTNYMQDRLKTQTFQDALGIREEDSAEEEEGEVTMDDTVAGMKAPTDKFRAHDSEEQQEEEAGISGRRRTKNPTTSAANHMTDGMGGYPLTPTRKGGNIVTPSKSFTGISRLELGQTTPLSKHNRDQIVASLIESPAAISPVKRGIQSMDTRSSKKVKKTRPEAE